MSSKENYRKQTLNQTFQELAKQNVKQSGRDYQIYFLTLTLAVALFYTFNSISGQFKALGIEDTRNFLGFASGVLSGVSIFICLIMGFLVSYANGFMLKRRKREMGVYMTLGMDIEDINHMLWQETLRIGAVSLVSGLGAGILLSQLLTLVTAKLIGMEAFDYHFMVSAKAIIFALIFFGIIFVVVYKRNIREIGKMQLIDLIYAERKNETMERRSKRKRWLLPLSIILIIAGCLKTGDTGSENYFASLGFGLLIVTAGIIGFFLSFLEIMIQKMKRNKRYYYSYLNMFDLNQIGGHLKNVSISTAIVCILVFLSISVAAIGMGLGKSEIVGMKSLAPYDVSMEVRADSGTDITNTTVERLLEQQKVMMSDYTADSVNFTIYSAKGVDNTIFAEADGEDLPVEIIGMDDYNDIMKLQGLDPISIGGTEYAINYDLSENQKILEDYVNQPGQTLHLEGTALTPAKDALWNRVYFDRNVFSDGGTLIVPQNVADVLTPMWIGYNGMFAKESSYTDFMDAFLHNQTTPMLNTKRDIEMEISSTNLMVSYMGIYLSITFLIVAGAVLALQQLSQTSDNESSYELLRKLGTRRADIIRSLRFRMKVYFGIPFLVAIVNASFVLIGTFRSITNLTFGEMMQAIVFSLGIVVIIYGLYFVMTYLGSKRILNLFRKK